MLKLELTLDEVNVVLGGLGELPAKVSVNVIDKIRAQVVPQVQAQQQAAAPAAMQEVKVEEAAE